MRVRWALTIMTLSVAAGCGVVEQPESARTVAAFAIPLQSEADREQFSAILRTAASAERMHLDTESKQDLQHAARASPFLEMTVNAAVWRGVNDDEPIAAAMDQHVHLGEVWLTFFRGKDPALTSRFHQRAMDDIVLRWPDTLSLPMMPSGVIPLHADLIRTPDRRRPNTDDSTKAVIEPARRA